MKKLSVLILMVFALFLSSCDDEPDYDEMMNDPEFHNMMMNRMMTNSEFRSEYYNRMMNDEQMREEMLDSIYRRADRDSVFMGRVYDYMMRYPGVNDRMRYYYEQENAENEK